MFLALARIWPGSRSFRIGRLPLQCIHELHLRSNGINSGDQQSKPAEAGPAVDHLHLGDLGADCRCCDDRSPRSRDGGDSSRIGDSGDRVRLGGALAAVSEAPGSECRRMDGKFHQHGDDR
jgi:hypothetical protein